MTENASKRPTVDVAVARRRFKAKNCEISRRNRSANPFHEKPIFGNRVKKCLANTRVA